MLHAGLDLVRPITCDRLPMKGVWYIHTGPFPFISLVGSPIFFQHTFTFL